MSTGSPDPPPRRDPDAREAGSGERLRCGADVDDLLEQVSIGHGDRLDGHQTGCPHCRAALAEYDRLWAPVRQVARTEVRAPDSVLQEALRRIRGAVSDPDHGTLPGPDGSTRISARVVVVTAREAAQDVVGVRVAVSRVVDGGTAAGDGEPHEQGPQVVAGVSGASAATEIVLAADYGTDLIALGERVRAAVAAGVRELTGLEPVAVNVHIDDVFG